jgi:hypothetical protein
MGYQNQNEAYTDISQEEQFKKPSSLGQRKNARIDLYPPGEEDAAVAAVLTRAAALDVRLPVRVHGIALPAPLAPPPLLAVLPREVLLDPRQVTKGPTYIHTSRWLMNYHLAC